MKCVANNCCKSISIYGDVTIPLLVNRLVYAFPLYLQLCGLAYFYYLPANSSLPLPQTALSGLMRETHCVISFF